MLDALRINSILWGGVYNPLVPLMKRFPRSWANRFPKSSTPAQVLEGYIHAYDPDYIVCMDNADQHRLPSGHQEVISATDIIENIGEDYTPKYGIGLFELLDKFVREEYKFERRKPLTMNIPVTERQYRIFVAAVFGELPERAGIIFRQHYRDACLAKDVPFRMTNYTNYFAPNNIYYKKLTSLFIKTRPKIHTYSSHYIFFFDATNILDVIDYWNLRALGFSVLPIPQQASSLLSCKKFAWDHILDCSRPYRHNPNIFHSATLIPSACAERSLLNEFLGSLCSQNTDVPSDRIPELTIQHWYPRIWENFGRLSDGVEPWGIEAGKLKHEVQGDEDSITVQQLDPEFCRRFGGHGSPRFANAVSTRFYGSKQLVAEVMPESGRTMTKAIDSWSLNKWRFSRTGPVYLAEHIDWTFRITRPLGSTVFNAWMSERGWETTLSSAGHIATQMAAQLGGVWGLSLLAKKGLIELLGQLPEGRSMVEGQFRSKMHRIKNDEKYSGDMSLFLKPLIESKIFCLGVELQCSICRQRSWFSLADMDYQVVCPKCLQPFRIPSHAPDEIKWAYRTLGPFSLPQKSYGVYSVLLTLNFFAQMLDGPTTPMLSFNAEKDGEKMEIDLGLFYQSGRMVDNKTYIIFSECKTKYPFTQADFHKMRRLREEFPGAVLVFSTLRSRLSETEQNRIKSFVNISRRARQKSRPFNHILILTATELCGNYSLNQTWRDAGGEYGRFCDANTLRDLEAVCDATQQLYLGVESWCQWLDKKRKGKNMPRVAKESSKNSRRKDGEKVRPVSLRIMTRVREVQYLGEGS